MKTRRQANQKVDPRLTEIEWKIAAAASMPPAKARKAVRILARLHRLQNPPFELPPKAGPRFRAFYWAYYASQDLKACAERIHLAALYDQKLFFKYLGKFLEKKLKRLPIISEDHARLLQLYYENPRLQASEAIKRGKWKGSKETYRAEKKRALARQNLLSQVHRGGFCSS